MKTSLLKLINRASDLVDGEPLIALFLGAALLAVFFACFLPSKPDAESTGNPSLLWTLYAQFKRLIRATVLVGLLVATLSVLRVYLRHTVTDFSAESWAGHAS